MLFGAQGATVTRGGGGDWEDTRIGSIVHVFCPSQLTDEYSRVFGLSLSPRVIRLLDVFSMYEATKE